jgi:two-component system sensor histidine kinase KdpD
MIPKGNIRMSRPIHNFQILLKYILALLTLTLTTAPLYLLREDLGTPLVALLFLIPVGLTTTFWGLGPGIMVAFCAFLTFNFFFIEPYYTFSVHHTRDLLVLIVFLVTAVIISQLVGRAQAGMTAAMAREREATKLYELSTSLAGLQEDRGIARVLAEQVLQTFKPEQIELSINGYAKVNSFKIQLPSLAPSLARNSEASIPVQTGRGLVGIIHLWRANPLTQAEERLLKTFASQGAMALERAWLAQAETRTQVLEESDRLKSALLSSVSHELRTPLSTIKAAITSLRSGEVSWNSSAREDLLAAVDDETDHLNRLVGNLLDMSRIESGALKPKRQWNLLGEIVGSVIASLGKLIENHKLEIDIPENLPFVPVDYVLMEQVFSNLISNSLKYAPADTTIWIHAQAEKDSTVHVQVCNQGPPVPEEHLARIFDKFYRVTAADRVTGTGLGLSICKGIIEAHAGRIWAENLPDGFAFNFTLPLNWEGSPPPQPSIEPEAI